EWYIYNFTGDWATPEHLEIMEINSGWWYLNYWYLEDGLDGVEVRGYIHEMNATSGKIIIDPYKNLYPPYPGHSFVFWGEYNTYFGWDFPFLIPIEEEGEIWEIGKVSADILNSVKNCLGYFYRFEHEQAYSDICSIFFWNDSFSNAYLKLNYTNDGILTNLEVYGVNFTYQDYDYLVNTTLYSKPARLPPVFNFTTEDGILTINSTDIKLKIIISDADNNNDGTIDTDYKYRIFNGKSWTLWKKVTPLINLNLVATKAGNYTIKLEVKNMYGNTQEQITIEYIPPESTDEVIFPYLIIIISIVLLLGLSILIYSFYRKLRS
ncbi:MAG: hypothetical protein ACFFA6_12565, partial [Promethearchaeota archaeon]